MKQYRDISDADANEFVPLDKNEMDCVLDMQDFSRFKFNMDTCQVLTDMATFTIVVRGKLLDKDLPFEGRIHRDRTMTFELNPKS